MLCESLSGGDSVWKFPFSLHREEWALEKLNDLLMVLKKKIKAKSSLSTFKVLGLSHKAPAYEARCQISLFKTCSQSFLAPLGSAEGFPFPVTIPTLMVLQEGDFPPVLVWPLWEIIYFKAVNSYLEEIL